VLIGKAILFQSSKLYVSEFWDEEDLMRGLLFNLYHHRLRKCKSLFMFWYF